MTGGLPVGVKGEEMLDDLGTTRKYVDGEIIFRQGDQGTEMYVVRSGHVKIFRTKQDREVTLATLGSDDFFGEMALFSDSPRSASAQAVGETLLRVIDKNTFMGLMKHPFVWTVLSRMGERVREVDEKIEQLSVQDQVRKEHLSSLVTRSRWIV